MKTKKELLSLKSVVVDFDGFKAVNKFNLNVQNGELRCLIGPNGAGKTTVMDIICGKTKSISGEVIFDKEPITNLEEHIIARKGIGRKFQIPSVFKELTVKDNLYVALNSDLGFFKNIFKFFNKNDKEKIHEIAEFVGLKDDLEKTAQFLSHGQTQWLEIALVVLKEPKLILMDEPTAGMTNYETSQTAELFNKLKKTQTLIVVEHDMGFVKEISDIISVMHQGKLLSEGKASEIEKDEKVKEAYLGHKGITNA
ncbi:urea ABC transporter ATP-binding protein UrtD [Candidatus Pelagibacter sp.]|uniref:urea ABC transporter ATP-binding protein UrtD n=1 Tax=Candidatus Pelagibacter sp. TaxID=2024849 RepID=UPI003D11BBDE